MSKTLIAIAALMLVGAAQAAGSTTIDLFSTRQAKLRDTTVGGVLSSEVGSVGDTTILGGFRELLIDQTITPGFGEESTIGVSGGLLKYSNEFGASSTATVRWDGRSAVTGGAINPTGLGGLNIGNTLTDLFELKVIFADGGYFFRIDAYTDATHWSSVKISALENRSPATSYIPMAAFLDCNNAHAGGPLVAVSCGAGGAVNFGNLGALQVVVDVDSNSVALDLAVNQITAVPVPEPASALLLLGGLGLVAGASRLRRQR